MSAYTRHAGAQPVSGILYRLENDLVWRIGHIDGPSYTVPKGFIFDVSIPRLLCWVFNPHDSAYHKAAALHDHMLIAGWSRVSAAAEFHQALVADGVTLWRRLAMFLATALWRYS